MKVSKNQQGVGLVGLILTVIIFGALVYLSWNIYQTRFNNQPAKTPASGQTNEGSVAPIEGAENLENSDKFSE